MLKILVTDGIDNSAVRELETLGHEVYEKFYEPDKLRDVIKYYDIIIVRSATSIRKAIIDSAAETGKLKMIIRAGVGVDNIDIIYAEDKGIKVRNTPNSSSSSVAELVLAHIFSLARFVGISNVTMRAGQWNKTKYKGIELSGKTLGLIGFGRISLMLAKKASALGMNIIYTNRSGPKEDYPEYSYMELDELLKKSDFVSIHTPAMKDGKALMDREKISIMKDGSYLINCARGGVVDELALLDALNSRKLSGAAIDVFQVEPPSNLELLNHPNVSVTPHIGGSTNEAQMRIGAEVIELIKSL